jgi:hypothetical protein
VRSVTLLLFAFTLWVPAAIAQVPTPRTAQQQPPSPEDTVKVPQFRVEPPVSPLCATWRSLLLPGWGQSILGRRLTGAVFVFWEGLTLGMTLKSVQQLRYQEQVGAETVEDKRQEIQDWAVLLAFNHLVAAAEAYVSAQLWDFPGSLRLRSLPGEVVGAEVRLKWD